MGKTQKISQRYKASKPHKLGISKLNLTSRVGLIIVAQLMQRLGLTQLVDQQLPAPGNNCGYRRGSITMRNSSKLWRILRDVKKW